MAVSVDLEIVGIKEALAELNKMDRVARREITQDFRKVTEPVVSEAQQRLPLGAPMSGWNRSWTTRSGAQLLPYDRASDIIVAKVSGKRPKMFAGYMQNVATFYVRFSGPTSVLLDMSGKKGGDTEQGNRMIQVLSQRFGPPSRILWPAYETNKDKVEEEVRKIVDKVMQYVNEGIAGAKSRARERAAAKAA